MMLRCGTVQFHHKADDKAYNMAVVEHFCREAAESRVKILAFPEMCLTGYWHVRNLGRERLEALAEPVPSPCRPGTAWPSASA
jgi:predicted amidohydrolase